MTDQTYSNHARFVPGYHYVLSALLTIGTIGSFVNIWLQCPAGNSFMTPALILLLFICCLFIFILMRTFPLKAQDRAIRAEESLRYFILTRKPFDSKLTLSQIIALRFAPDDELIPLVERAINENLSAKEIKGAIKNWRPDYHRI